MDFGSIIKIKSSPETEKKGLAGKTGNVHGWTTPSKSGVEVIGEAKNDSAINVYFDDLDEAYWFDQSLLEIIDEGIGTVITLNGVDKKWTKGKNGEWIEENTNPSKSPDISEKKWWEFWK